MQAKHLAATASNQACAKIEVLLKETMGLHSASIGSSAITSSIQRRMATCEQSSAAAYLAQLLTSARELDALIEEVVIPETWFFRDVKAFDALRRFVTNEWEPEHTRGVLRILSLPCSTGEEPYSIAMTLIKTGLSAKRIHIDAVDISVQALARARRAIYGGNAFRGDDIAFRDRFFHNSDTGYALDENIRQQINFIQANMLDAAFMPGYGMYDVIFCRNVMIYFDSVTQSQAVGVLSRLLHAQGILFVGHAESSMILNHGYVSEHISRAFAFRKAGFEQLNTPGRQSLEHQHGSGIPTWLHDPIDDKKKISSPPLPRSQSRLRPSSEAPPPADSLEQAFCLANEGSLVEAANLCETWLQDNEPCAKACYLLGLIREVAGNRQEAEDYLRKAVYLQPNHQEALVHLALLVERKGDTAAAEVLRQRAQRASEQHAAVRHYS